ncbi:MAG: hypothetical protein EZS28_050359, partial [Streblomastix strix]
YKYEREVKLRIRFDDGVKGEIKSRCLNQEKYGQTLKTGKFGVASLSIKLINRNEQIPLKGNDELTEDSAFIFQFKNSEFDGEIDAQKKVIRLNPIIDFESWYKRPSYTFSYFAPVGYTAQIEKVSSPWQEMKYETIWEDSIVDTSHTLLQNHNEYKYRFAIIRASKPTDIFLQILAFGQTDNRQYKYPALMVYKMEEKLENSAEIKKYLEILKDNQKSLCEREPLFSFDNLCNSEFSMQNYNKQSEIEMCFPSSSNRLPEEGDYIVEFDVKGPQTLTLFGFAYTNECPIEVFYLSS